MGLPLGARPTLRQHPRGRWRHAASAHQRVARRGPRLGQLRSHQPGGSIDDSVALSAANAAEKSGALEPRSTVTELPSGPIGTGLAMVAVVKGYGLMLELPDRMTVERRRRRLASGATFEPALREQSMNGAMAREFTDRTDALAAGFGIGSHVTQWSMVLQQRSPTLQVCAGELSGSPVSAAASPCRTRSKALARASCRRACTWTSSTARSRPRPRKRARWRAAATLALRRPAERRFVALAGTPSGRGAGQRV